MNNRRSGHGRRRDDISDGVPRHVDTDVDDETPAIRSMPLPAMRAPTNGRGDGMSPTPPDGTVVMTPALWDQIAAKVARTLATRAAEQAPDPRENKPAALETAKSWLYVIAAVVGLFGVAIGGYKLILERPTGADVAAEIDAHAAHPHAGHDEGLGAVRDRSDSQNDAVRARMDAAESQIAVLTSISLATKETLAEIRADVKLLLEDRR